jgi:hypothetical protein
MKLTNSMKILMAVAAFALASGTVEAQIAVRVFGRKEARPAINLGHKLRRAGFLPGLAEAEFWRVGWQKYPDDRFFVRCFVSTAQYAYEGQM